MWPEAGHQGRYQQNSMSAVFSLIERDGEVRSFDMPERSRLTAFAPCWRFLRIRAATL